MAKLLTGNITIPKQAYPGLGELADHADALPSLQAVAEALGERATVGLVRRGLVKKASIADGSARAIVRALMDLHAVRDRFDSTPDELFEKFTATFEKDAEPEWRARHLDNWRAHRDVIIQALAPDHPVQALGKAARLAYAQQALLTDVRIITDLRPVFSAAADSIRRSIVMNHLIIDYVDGGRHKTLSVTLDIEDIDRLHRLSERARKKVATLTEVMKTQPWPTIVIGEEATDDDGI
jgi:hypothetical protein